jgi:hypothetical protein
MKKNILSIVLFMAVVISINAQDSKEEPLKKYKFTFDIGVPFLTSGGFLGAYFDFRYQYRLNKRMSIGGMMAFVSSGEDRRAIGSGEPELIYKNTLENGFSVRRGLIILEENEYKTEHIGGSFLFNYDLIAKKKRTLSAYIGLGLTHVSIQNIPFIARADVRPIISSEFQRYVLFVPEYTRLIDVSMPFGISYHYHMNDRLFIGTDWGVTLYQKYTGFYYHAAFSIGFRFP